MSDLLFCITHDGIIPLKQGGRDGWLFDLMVVRRCQGWGISWSVIM